MPNDTNRGYPQDRRALLSGYNNKKKRKKTNDHLLEEAEEKPDKTRIGFSLDNTRKKANAEIPVIVIDDSDDDNGPQTGDGPSNNNDVFDSESDDDENEGTNPQSTLHSQKNRKRSIRRSRSSLSLESDADEEEPVRRRVKRGPIAKNIAPRQSAPATGQLRRRRTVNTDTAEKRQSASSNHAAVESAPKRQRFNPAPEPKSISQLTTQNQNTSNPSQTMKGSNRAPINKTISQIRPPRIQPGPPNVGLCKICHRVRVLTARGDVCSISCVASKPLIELHIDQPSAKAGNERGKKDEVVKRVRCQPPSNPVPASKEIVRKPSNFVGTAAASTKVNPSTQQVAKKGKSVAPNAQPKTKSQPQNNSTGLEAQPSRQNSASRVMNGNSDQPKNATEATSTKQGERKLAVLNISEVPEHDESAQSRLKFFLHRPRRIEPSAKFETGKYSPFGYSIEASGYSRAQVCSVCGGTNELSFTCEICQLVFHSWCVIPSLQAYNPQSPRCRGCESATEGVEAPDNRVSASSIRDGLKRLIFDAKSGNPISFVLHPALHNLFLRLYKSDFLVCSECSKFRNVQSGVVGECLSAPFHCSSAFWWDNNRGYQCIQPVPEEHEATVAIAKKKCAYRSRRRVRLFYSGFGEKHRSLFGYPDIHAVVDLDVENPDPRTKLPSKKQDAPANKPRKQSSEKNVPSSTPLPSSNVRSNPTPNQSLPQPERNKTATNNVNKSIGPRSGASVGSNNVPIQNDQPDLGAAGITVSMEPAPANAAETSVRVMNNSPTGASTTPAVSTGVGTFLKSLANKISKEAQKNRSSERPLQATSAPTQRHVQGTSNARSSLPAGPQTTSIINASVPRTSGALKPSPQPNHVAPPVSSSLGMPARVPAQQRTVPLGLSPVGHPNTANNQPRNSVPVSTAGHAQTATARTSGQPASAQLLTRYLQTSASQPVPSPIVNNRGASTASNTQVSSGLVMQQRQQELFAAARMAAAQLPPNQRTTSRVAADASTKAPPYIGQRPIVAPPNTRPAQNMTSSHTRFVPNSTSLNSGLVPNVTPSNARLVTSKMQLNPGLVRSTTPVSAGRTPNYVPTTPARVPNTGTSKVGVQPKMGLTEAEMNVAKQWILNRIGKLPNQGHIENILVDLALSLHPQAIMFYNSFHRNPDRFDNQFIRLGKFIQEKRAKSKMGPSDGVVSATPASPTPTSPVPQGHVAQVQLNGRPLTPEQRIHVNELFRQLRSRQMSENIEFEKQLISQMQRVRNDDIGLLHQQQCQMRKRRAAEHSAQIRQIVDSIPSATVVHRPANGAQPMSSRTMSVGVQQVQPSTAGFRQPTPALNVPVANQVHLQNQAPIPMPYINGPHQVRLQNQGPRTLVQQPQQGGQASNQAIPQTYMQQPR